MNEFNDLKEPDAQEFLRACRVDHDRNTARWHSPFTVQARISRNLPPCPFCAPEEVELPR